MIRIFFIATAFAWCLAIPLARAYVPPSGFIVKNLAAKHMSLKSGLRVKAEVSNSGEIRFKATLVYDPQTKTLRAWASGQIEQEEKRLYQLERKDTGLGFFNLLCLSPNASDLEKNLIEKAVPIQTEEQLLALPDEEARRGAEVLSLRRWKGAPTWVIGKSSPSQSEAWFEKDVFLPLRLLFSPGADPLISEIAIEGYRYQHGFAFPKATLVSARDGHPMLREEVSDLVVGSVAADFKSPLGTSGFTEAGQAAAPELRALIELYFKILR